MSEQSKAVWRLEGTRVAVLADCHIHPADGLAFPPAVFEALAGADLIVTLGDMGEAVGLDQLSRVAPVVGVRGGDDADDPRTNHQALVLTSAEQAIGCIFDATAAGLATASQPFAPSPDFQAVAQRIFGRKIDVLLHASTHRPEASGVEGCRVFNPGSAVLPAGGAPRSFVRLSADETGQNWELVTLD